MVAMGERDARVGATGDGRGDSRHDFEWNVVLRKELQLFAAATEDERIATLQTHDPSPEPRLLEQQFVNATLRDGVPAGHLADADPVRIAACQVQDFVGDQPVVQDHVRFLQGSQRIQGEQAGIARTGANQHDAAAPWRIGMLQCAFEFALGARQVVVAHQCRDLPTHDGLVEAAPCVDVGQSAP